MAGKLKNKLGEFRAAKGIKKSQLAVRLKKSRAYVTRLERGEINPCLEVALSLARFFNKPVEEIFQLSDNHTEFPGFSRKRREPNKPTENMKG